MLMEHLVHPTQHQVMQMRPSQQPIRLRVKQLVLVCMPMVHLMQPTQHLITLMVHLMHPTQLVHMLMRLLRPQIHPVCMLMVLLVLPIHHLVMLMVLLVRLTRQHYMPILRSYNPIHLLMQPTQPVYMLTQLLLQQILDQVQALRLVRLTPHLMQPTLQVLMLTQHLQRPILDQVLVLLLAKPMQPLVRPTPQVYMPMVLSVKPTWHTMQLSQVVILLHCII